MDRADKTIHAATHIMEQMPPLEELTTEWCARFLSKYENRSSAEFDIVDHYGKDYQYPNAYIILVTPEHIKAQQAKLLMEGKDFVWLDDLVDLKTDRDIIVQYVQFVRKFFANC